MTISLETLPSCSEEALPFLRGTFDLFLTAEGEAERSVGNVRIGTIQEDLDVFEGFPPDGSEPSDRNTYFSRRSMTILVTADHFTCQNLALWLEAEPVNVPGGFRLNLEACGQRRNVRALLERDLCNGTILQLVLHRTQVVTPADFLLTQDSITAAQFSLRALRDSSRPADPYGYVQLVPGDCASS